MVDVLIDSRLLGTEKHLLVSDDGFLRCDKPPHDAMRLMPSRDTYGTKCWSTLQFLAARRTSPQPPEAYTRMMSSMVPEDFPVPWAAVIPSTRYKKYLNELVDFAKSSVDELTLRYYVDTWSAGSSLLSSLRPARTDSSVIDSMASSVHVSPIVETFRPRAGGYAQPVVYDRFGTVTGRLTVESGPNVLLLKKEYRNIIKSSFSSGSVVYLDFSSLEARVLLYESGGSCDGRDLYTSIAEKIGNVSRDAVKLAVLSELYGSSKNSLALTLGLSDSNLREFIKRVGEVINTKALLVSLKKQYSENGYIRNKFGRKLEVSRPQDNIFINYYAQSTGVDVAMLGFNQVVNALGTDGVRPLFVLHDALILDVREDRLPDVEAIVDVQVPGYSSKFPLKLEKL